jgi:hypothetical protein
VALFNIPGQAPNYWAGPVGGILSDANPSQQVYPNANYTNIVPGSKFVFAYAPNGANLQLTNAASYVNGVNCVVKDQFGTSYLPYHWPGYEITQDLVLTFDCEI